VCDAISLPQAVMLVFSAYYVLNIQYPSEGAKTLEFIQRLVVTLDMKISFADSRFYFI
jgi:hypothetical protein